MFSLNFPEVSQIPKHISWFVLGIGLELVMKNHLKCCSRRSLHSADRTRHSPNPCSTGTAMKHLSEGNLKQCEYRGGAVMLQRVHPSPRALPAGAAGLSADVAARHAAAPCSSYNEAVSEPAGPWAQA